jgi:hypothetical protein
MERAVSQYIVVLVALLTLGGYQQPPFVAAGSRILVPTHQSGARPISNQSELIDYLYSKGIEVEIVGGVRQSFLHPRGTRVCVNAEQFEQSTQLQVYTYDSKMVADADIQNIGPDGATILRSEPGGGGSAEGIEWIAPPHFFRNDQIVVLYFGDDRAVLKVLTEGLGPQFAGANEYAREYRLGRSESCQELRVRQTRNTVAGIITLATVTGVVLWMVIQHRQQRPDV